MKSLTTMTKDERSLLLFFEVACVDQSGGLNTQHMTADDMEIAKRWDSEGFIGFGRINSAIVFNGDRPKTATHWITLSDEAWELAHKERRARSNRIQQNSWKARSDRSIN